MINDLKKVTNNLILFQFVILLTVMSICVYLFGDMYIKQLKKISHDEINQTTQFLAAQIKSEVLGESSISAYAAASVDSIEGELTEEEYFELQGIQQENKSALLQSLSNLKQEVVTKKIGQRILGANQFKMFIINADGETVISRDANDMVDASIWQRYQNKLTYEMKKQKNGWSEYPEIDRFSWSQSNNIIRYLSIDELGWIVAVEAKQKSKLALLKESLNWKVYGILAGLLIITLVMTRTITYWHFIITERVVGKLWKNKHIHLNMPASGSSTVQFEPPKKVALETRQQKEEADVQSQPEQAEQTQSQESNEALREEMETFKAEIMQTLKQNAAQPSKNDAEPKEEESQIVQVKSKISDHLDHIKSPLLRQILSDFKDA